MIRDVLRRTIYERGGRRDERTSKISFEALEKFPLSPKEILDNFLVRNLCHRERNCRLIE